jgi:transcriptional regulator with XRE-family HTH domain
VAYHLRVTEALSIREIAAGLGVSHGTVGRWLKGVPRVRQPALTKINKVDLSDIRVDDTLTPDSG